MRSSQVTRSFRRWRTRTLHNPEFTIVEWYRGRRRHGRPESIVLDALMQSRLGPHCPPLERRMPPGVRTHAWAFVPTPHHRRTGRGSQIGERRGCQRFGTKNRPRQLAQSSYCRCDVEPELGRDRPEIIYHYPASQASLAKVSAIHRLVTKSRNGSNFTIAALNWPMAFTNWRTPRELRRRFEEVNVDRAAEGRPSVYRCQNDSSRLWSTGCPIAPA